MHKAETYRAHAGLAVKLARRSTTPTDEALMLRIAQGWIELAAQAEAPA
jgi:hypothetical protein